MVSPGSYNLAECLPLSRSTKYTINSKGRKQKQEKIYWNDHYHLDRTKSVHRLVSHLDHLNHCSIRHKNEVMQMNQTVRFGAIKKNVLEKYST